MIAGDELVARLCGSDDQRHEQTAQRDRLREVVDVRGVKLAHVVAHENLVKGEPQLAR